jgi:hypothetical protein
MEERQGIGSGGQLPFCLFLIKKEHTMDQKQTMSTEERLDLIVKGGEYLRAGNKAEAMRLMKQVPLAPHLAKVAKEFIGADFLIKGGFNLSDAEAEFGPDWLTQ